MNVASIEAMIKEASRSLAIRVKRQAGAAKELKAAQDMDTRAVARLDAAEKAATALDTEVSEKAELVSRLTGRPADEILNEIKAELSADTETAPEADGDGVPNSDGPDTPAAPKVSKAKATKPVADAPQA
jgi:hypothetical protein